jgi:exodeoxyribonuclease III
MKLVSVNVNGLRAAVRKGFLDWLSEFPTDVVCLQEIRIQEHQLTEAMRNPGGMKAWYHPAQKAGYSGVALYSRREPDRVQLGMGIEKYDQEGRVMTADFGSLRVISLYLPSGSAKEERQNFKYQFMDDLVPWLDRQRHEAEHVVVCGDWNIAHRKIDLKNWRGNQKNSGFLPQERAWMGQLFEQHGWVDTYRRLYPDLEAEAYTWWSNRGQAWANNTGWRIDYQIATEKFAKHARKASVYKDQRFSDHSPLVIDFDYSVAK